MLKLFRNIIFPHLWLSPGILGVATGALVGMAGSYLGGKEDKEAASDNEQISEEAKLLTLGELGESWHDIEDWLNPYLVSGEKALGEFKDKMGFSPKSPVFNKFNFNYKNLDQNPAYQFVRDQGLKAVDRVQAKNRNLGSGNRMTAAMDYASGVASQEYENEFQRQFQSNEYNNQLRQQKYQNRTDQFDRKMDNRAYLATMGANQAGNLSNFRDNLAFSRSNAFANRSAEATANNLLASQGKKNFLDSVSNFGGMMAGGFL